MHDRSGMRLRLLVAAICGVVLQCRTVPREPEVQKPIAPGTNTKWFTAVSSQELRLADGVTGTLITGPDGTATGATFTARDNDTQKITCACTGGCSGNCHIVRDDQTGYTSYTCVGNCTGSEGNACPVGPCHPVEVPTRASVVEHPGDVPPSSTPRP